MPTKRKKTPQRQTASQRAIAELEERIVSLEADNTSLKEALLAAGKEAEERVAIYRDRWVNAGKRLAESEASLRETLKLLELSQRDLHNLQIRLEEAKEESGERSKDTLMLVRLLRLSEETEAELRADPDSLRPQPGVSSDGLLAFLFR